MGRMAGIGRGALPESMANWLRRDRVALVFACITMIGLAVAVMMSNGMRVLMPGPLTSAHGTIENCSSCHTKSGDGKLSWIHGLIAGDPLADSKACLSCHKMAETALNAHGVPAEHLKRRTERLTKVAAASPQSLSERAQSVAFPAQDLLSRDLPCATCHQEHQGGSAGPAKLSSAQCRLCHVVKFDSFTDGHPKFEGYPFNRRTRIVYDHNAHFDKHYPEVAKKEPSKLIPKTCSSCHNSDRDRRLMSVAPFEATCSGCHIDQITGKERVSGPKGIAFLALPGLDLETLRKRNAAIGEWPVGAENALSPFTQLMISRTEKGQTLINTLQGVNLQDLTKASDDQVKAVVDLAWEIKNLIFSMAAGNAPGALGGLKLDRAREPDVVRADELMASLPRAVVVSAQQQWLPNLPRELVKGPDGNSVRSVTEAQTQQEAAVTPTAGPSPQAEEPTAEPEAPPEEASSGASAAGSPVKRDPPACLVRLFGQCLVAKDVSEAADAAPSGETDTESAKSVSRKSSSAPRERPGAMRAGLNSVEPPARSARKLPSVESLTVAGGTAEASRGRSPNSGDDLLSPTADELREIDAHNKASGKPARRVEDAAGSGAGTTAGLPGMQAVPDEAKSLDNDVDPESWAEHGGWYHQDYVLYYRPGGHKDGFITSWLKATGAQRADATSNPAAAVFAYLTGKDAPGSCTKCHSVDAAKGQVRAVNFSPQTVEQKRGRFTRFVHEPHFGVTGNRGCVTCHELQKGRAYLKSYEQGDAHFFTSEFSAVGEDRCRSCHNSSKARHDCLTCHSYHVNGVITPITGTTLPAP